MDGTESDVEEDHGLGYPWPSPGRGREIARGRRRRRVGPSRINLATGRQIRRFRCVRWLPIPIIFSDPTVRIRRRYAPRPRLLLPRRSRASASPAAYKQLDHPRIHGDWPAGRGPRRAMYTCRGSSCYLLLGTASTIAGPRGLPASIRPELTALARQQ
jgi:hypothetical protein